jgi:hypothetical protein
MFALFETIATNSLDLGLKFSYLFGHLFNQDYSNFECICVHQKVSENDRWETANIFLSRSNGYKEKSTIEASEFLIPLLHNTTVEE